MKKKNFVFFKVYNQNNICINEKLGFHDLVELLKDFPKLKYIKL